MLAKTTTRVDAHTSPSMRKHLQQRLVANVRRFVNADRHQIDQRMKELDKEWSVERVIEVEASAMIGLGATLGLLHNRKWFALSGLATSMVVLHNTRGSYPLLPVFQRLGFRSQKDILDERNALKVLNKEHERYSRH
jgi:hypothetical protein